MLQNNRLNFLNQKDQIHSLDLVFSVRRKSPSGRGFFDEEKVVLWGGDCRRTFQLATLICGYFGGFFKDIYGTCTTSSKRYKRVSARYSPLLNDFETPCRNIPLPVRTGFATGAMIYSCLYRNKTKQKSKFPQGSKNLAGIFEIVRWWRRGESNPRPRKIHAKHLQA